jgi:hypothetical protein
MVANHAHVEKKLWVSQDSKSSLIPRRCTSRTCFNSAHHAEMITAQQPEMQIERLKRQIKQPKRQKHSLKEQRKSPKRQSKK